MTTKKISSALAFLCFNLFITGIILILCSYFSILNLINLNFIFILTFVFGFLSFVFWRESKERRGFWFKIPKYIFIILLLLIVLISLKFKFLKPATALLNPFQSYLVMGAILSGALTFYLNKNVIEKIEEEKTSEENAGGERADEFNFRFKRLAWFNFNYGIGDAWGNEKYVLWLLRILISPFVWVARLQYVLTKWAYKEGWWYSGTLIAIIIINFIFVFPLLGDFIGGDEFHTYSVAKTLSKTGKFNLAWNFLYNTPGYNYKMSLIPQVNLAIFFKLFGENIVIAHMSSFLFSIVFIFLSYYLIKKFLNKPIAIFFIIYFTTTPFFIFQSIYIREYIYLLVISLTIPFLLIKISMIQKNKNLFFYIAFTLILIYIAYGLRIFSLLFLIPLIFSSLINIYTRSIKKLK